MTSGSVQRVVTALCIATIWGAIASAQPPQGRGGAPMPPPQNLQVLPKDTPRADVLVTMRGFTQGLGVDCVHCHVQEGRGGRNDFSVDEKPAKVTARAMLRMTNQINETIATGLGKPASSLTRVTCATCHRGATTPTVEPVATAR